MTSLPGHGWHLSLPETGQVTPPPSLLLTDERPGGKRTSHLWCGHQAKALKDLHEGVHDPAVLKELWTTTDLALQATKFTVRSLGHKMSTLVVQEHHLWPT